MTATTEARTKATAPGIYGYFPVQASKTIYEGTIIVIGKSDAGSGVAGHVKDYESGDETDHELCGIADDDADNSSGAAAAVDVKVRIDACNAKLVCAAGADANHGVTAYATDNQTVQFTFSASALAIGRVSKVPSSTVVHVRMFGLGGVGGGGSTSAVDAPLDLDVNLTAAGYGIDLTVNINHATGVLDALNVSAVQDTTARTGGEVNAIAATTTSLAGDTGSPVYSTFRAETPTDGGGTVVHAGLTLETGYDRGVWAADSVPIVLGTDLDDTIQHDGTDTTWVHTTGDINIDNQAVTGSTVFVLGADTNAVDFQVQDNSQVAQLAVFGSGQVHLGNHAAWEGVDAVQPGTTNQTITVAQLMSSMLFFEDPEGAGTWTLPTAALLVAGIDGARVGTCIGPIFIGNNATNASGEAITIEAGTGGTLYKPAGVTATITEGTSHYGILFFRLTNVTASSEAYDVWLLTEG